jgi:hypothetical protein
MNKRNDDAKVLDTFFFFLFLSPHAPCLFSLFLSICLVALFLSAYHPAILHIFVCGQARACRSIDMGAIDFTTFFPSLCLIGWTGRGTKRNKYMGIIKETSKILEG